MRILLVTLILTWGCSPVVVRDAKVYKAELDFVDMAAEEVVERGRKVIEKECTCSEKIAGVRSFSTRECREMAETLLTIEYRMKYHTGQMRYLGDLTDEKMAESPPDIPGTNTLCP